MEKSQPRVPLPATIDLPGSQTSIQVNHCKMPDCANFGVPARTKQGKTGPSKDRDPHYKLHSTKGGQIPAIRCKTCLDMAPVRSNDAIAQEVERLAQESGIWRLEEVTGCINEDCLNHARPVSLHPDQYRKRGKPKSGNGQYYQCRCCGRRTLVSDPVRVGDYNKRLAVDILSRISNKGPVRCTVRGARMRSTRAYYPMIDFLHRRCRAYSGSVDRAFIDGRFTLPEDMNVQSDAQVYQLNWVSRLDRRNVELSTYCTVDADSHFILALNCNFDGRVDPFEINTRAARTCDLARAEGYRKHAQYWLAGDELAAGRAMARRDRSARSNLLGQIERLYTSAASRKDVENIELHTLDTSYSTPLLNNGLQVHMPYMCYAQWFLLHEIFAGAGVKSLQVNTDIDSMGRAAFLSAFAEEVKRGDAHLFFVNFTKHQTIDERGEILRKARRTRRAFAQTLPASVRKDWRQVGREMMKSRLKERQKYGKWDDEWVVHPLPTVNEPRKAMSWLTPDPDLDEERKADMFLRSGLSTVDNVFLKTRRLVNAVERPIDSAGGKKRVWHGYAPYNPAMLTKYLTIFRAVNNWVFVGDDGKTPAMRLGFTKEPLEFEDIVWPEQRGPRPRAVRRRGKKMVAA